MDSRNGSIMLILSSPSGSGKTTLTKKIQQKYQNFKISVSHTTRRPRPNEVEGVDYFFVSKEIFEKKISNNEFYEYAKIFDNFYGTSRDSVNSLLKNNNNILANRPAAYTQAVAATRTTCGECCQSRR